MAEGLAWSTHHINGWLWIGHRCGCLSLWWAGDLKRAVLPHLPLRPPSWWWKTVIGGCSTTSHCFCNVNFKEGDQVCHRALCSSVQNDSDLLQSVCARWKLCANISPSGWEWLQSVRADPQLFGDEFPPTRNLCNHPAITSGRCNYHLQVFWQ